MLINYPEMPHTEMLSHECLTTPLPRSWAITLTDLLGPSHLTLTPSGIQNWYAKLDGMPIRIRIDEQGYADILHKITDTRNLSDAILKEISYGRTIN